MELASCSFGQSSKVSYLQMLTAVCAVVNGGRLMQPYVVQRITAPDGTIIKEVEPTVKRQVISAETSATMCKLMEGVVTKGTGTRAAVPGYRVGGKSGTSQKLDSKNEGARIASFVAVAPIEAPRLAVLICLDRTPQLDHQRRRPLRPRLRRGPAKGPAISGDRADGNGRKINFKIHSRHFPANLLY